MAEDHKQTYFAILKTIRFPHEMAKRKADDDDSRERLAANKRGRPKKNVQEQQDDPETASDKTKPFFQCIKTSLKSVVRNETIIEKLTKAALLTNRIMTHSLQFLKLYMIHCYDNGSPLPVINKPFVNAVMKILCVKTETRGKPPSADTEELKATLTAFYLEHYEPLKVPNDTMNYTNLGTVLDYMAIEVITMYENNIKQHFCEYVERFVNVSKNKKQLIDDIKAGNDSAEQKKQRVNELCRQLRKVKNDILSLNEPKTSDAQYHAWIARERLKVMPQRALKEGTVYYDIQCTPQDYLPFMVYMMKAVEEEDCTINSVFPLRSQIIPKHFRLDTTSLVLLLFTNENGKKTDFLSKGALKERQSEVWGFFFKTEMKCFHRSEDDHSYTFHHQIETDGVSCSIILIRKDKVGKIVKTPKAKKGGGEEYIDELKPGEREELRNKKVVGIDPNMSDLLFCVDSDQKSQTQFRYTQNTRRKETKFKKYRNLLQQLKEETVIGGRRVLSWEADMSAFNKKTLDFKAFKVYIKAKNALNVRLAPFYNKYLFRKLKLGSYCRRQITEARMLRRFEKLFGSAEEAVVCIGDWEQRQHRKFKEPVKGKGFRTLFRKAGYKVYLVDEFRTSCRCSACEEHGVCSTFRKCENPRPYREGRIVRHGLVKCQTCSRLWNRDVNASSNIWKIASEAINGRARPRYLRRAQIN
jgi:hypothetical protein